MLISYFQTFADIIEKTLFAAARLRHLVSSLTCLHKSTILESSFLTLKWTRRFSFDLIFRI